MDVGPSSESHKAKYNVAVLGAAGGIGQTLSLLMKQSKYIKSLRLCESPPIVPLSLSLICFESSTIRNCLWEIFFLFLFFYSSRSKRLTLAYSPKTIKPTHLSLHHEQTIFPQWSPVWAWTSRTSPPSLK